MTVQRKAFSTRIDHPIKFIPEVDLYKSLHGIKRALKREDNKLKKIVLKRILSDMELVIKIHTEL